MKGKCEFCKEVAELQEQTIDEGEKVMICEGCVENLIDTNS